MERRASDTHGIGLGVGENHFSLAFTYAWLAACEHRLRGRPFAFLQ